MALCINSVIVDGGVVGVDRVVGEFISAKYDALSRGHAVGFNGSCHSGGTHVFLSAGDCRKAGRSVPQRRLLLDGHVKYFIKAVKLQHNLKR